MTGPRSLDPIVDRFNSGIRHVIEARNAWRTGDMRGYESAVRTATVEVVGSLEWALKLYLRRDARQRMLKSDELALRQPTFHTLVELMEKYADPPLDSEQVSHLYAYRSGLRNAAEHSASVPPAGELEQAIREIRQLIISYLSCDNEKLAEATTISGERVHLNPDQVREYYQFLRSRFEFMDLGGISPHVGGKVVRIRMSDLYIPLNGVRDAPLFEENVLEGGAAILDLFGEPSEDDLPILGSPTRPLDLDDLLRHPRLIVLGHPGSGKSTIGKHLAYSVASGHKTELAERYHGYVPILIRAADYGDALRTDPSLSMYDYIRLKSSSRFGALFESALKTGRALIVIDGLDEISSSERRVVAAGRTEVFVAEFAQNAFVITSRIVGYRHNRIGGDFRHISLVDFDDNQILGFIQKWYSAIEVESGAEGGSEEVPGKAGALYSAIQSNRGIRKLAGNPLLLTIIALANWRGTRLPTRRVELYQIASETLVENWPLKQRGVSVDASEIISMLEPIAFHMLTKGRPNLISERDFRPLFEAQIQEIRGGTPQEVRSISREILLTIEEHTGFFLERGTDEHGQRAYGFLHLTFAEYLSARCLAEQWASGGMDLSRYLLDPSWHEVILLMAGHVGTWGRGQATRLVKDILTKPLPFDEFLHGGSLLAGAILTDNVRIHRDVQEEVIRRIVELFVYSPFTELRRAAFEMMSSIADILPTPRVTYDSPRNRTDNPSERYRHSVAEWVLSDHSPDSLRTLLREFGGAPEAADVPFSLPILLSNARTHFGEEMSFFAVGTDEEDLDLGSVPTRLAAVLEERGWPNVRVERFTVDGWVRVRGSPQTRVLVSIVDRLSAASAPTPVLAHALAEEGIRTYSLQNALAEGPCGPHLVKRLKSQMRSAGDATRNADAIDALYAILPPGGEDDDYAFGPVRFNAADFTALRGYLAQPDARRALAAFRLLYIETSKRQLSRLLLTGLSHSAEEVRLRAVQYLVDQYASGGEVSARERNIYFEWLRGLQSDASAAVKDHVLIGMIRIAPEHDLFHALNVEPSERAIQTGYVRHLIIRALYSDEPGVESLLARAFGRLVQHHGIAAYITSSAYSLQYGGRPRPKIAEAVLPFIEDDDPAVANAAAFVWLLFRSEVGAELVFVRLLRSPHKFTLTEACDAVRESSGADPDIRSALYGLLDHESVSVVKAAALALQRLADSAFVEIARGIAKRRLSRDPNDPAGFHLLWTTRSASSRPNSD